MSAKNKSQLGKSSRKSNLGPARPAKKIAKMAARIRSKASKKGIEERENLQEGFLKRIAQ